jgi:RHS repeat-associated protein
LDDFTLARRYLHGPLVDQVLAQEDVAAGPGNENVDWLLADHQGTVRDIVRWDDTAGETVTVTHFTYDTFGNVTSGDTTQTRYLYTGRDWDADTGLQYNRARWYDPATGRWVSEDPIGFAGGDANLSRYVGNSATVATDPSGLEVEGGFRPWFDWAHEGVDTVPAPPFWWIPTGIGALQDSFDSLERIFDVYGTVSESCGVAESTAVTAGVFFGDAVGITYLNEAWTGEELLTGRKLSRWERNWRYGLGSLQLGLSGWALYGAVRPLTPYLNPARPPLLKTPRKPAGPATIEKSLAAEAAGPKSCPTSGKTSKIEVIDEVSATRKRGPKTDPNAPHNATIRTHGDLLETGGNRIIAGGGKLPERLIKTDGGLKGGRRPDILLETPNGQIRGRNVGKTDAAGNPIKRELEALDDLNNFGGIPTDFVPYD